MSTETALRELIARVDADQVRAVWIAPDQEAVQRIVRNLDRRSYDDRGRISRVTVSLGRETYRHRDGGTILFVAPRTGRLRGQTVDEIHDHSAPATWSPAFAGDVVVLRTCGARIHGVD